MKAELRIAPHSVLPGQNVVEVWFADQFIATVAGADAPGVRVVSKYGLKLELDEAPLNVATVTVGDGNSIPSVSKLRQLLLSECDRMREYMLQWRPNLKIEIQKVQVLLKNFNFSMLDDETLFRTYSSLLRDASQPRG
jgi:hypothetical protein